MDVAETQKQLQRQKFHGRVRQRRSVIVVRVETVLVHVASEIAQITQLHRRHHSGLGVLRASVPLYHEGRSNPCKQAVFVQERLLHIDVVSVCFRWLF